MSSVSSVTTTPDNQAASFLNTNNTNVPITTDGAQTLGVNDFLKLIATQLTEQDPLQPMQDTEFISQMASFTSLQQMQTLSSNFTTYSAQEKSISAQDYLGKTVTVQTSAGNITGPVTGITYDSGSPLVTVNGGSFDPSSIISVTDTAAASTSSTNTATTPTTATSSTAPTASSDSSGTSN